MSGFSFDATAGASQSSVKPRLTANCIHTVKLESCEKVDVQGVKEVGKVFKVLKLKFSNSEGMYEHTMFEPEQSKGHFTRTTSSQGYANASVAENTMLFFKHIIDAFAPNVGKEIDAKTKSLSAPNWDKLRDLIVTILTNSKEESKIKLILNNKGEAQFPAFFTGVTKEGVAYIKNNFIGNKIAFSAYEMGEIKKASESKITPMNTKDDLVNIKIEESNDDLDLNF